MFYVTLCFTSLCPNPSISISKPSPKLLEAAKLHAYIVLNTYRGDMYIMWLKKKQSKEIKLSSLNSAYTTISLEWELVS
ncbi:hypothetical protein Tco_1080667 [Tanacetum coccineum]|uniref:Uncharacterized protein n=1 Tax=Tanacetum coccineum TaxID=301880 RepID=A0ABQ5HXB1_9ASTR